MQTNKIIVRMNGLPKDITSTDIIPLEESDPIRIEEEVSDLSPWDQAHLAYQQNSDINFAEPDIDASKAYSPLTYSISQAATVAKGLSEKEEYYNFMDYWPKPDKPSIWHLGDEFSQLKSAREEIKSLGSKKIVRIAHFDTGYDAGHVSYPRTMIRSDLERNFVEDEQHRAHNASDSFQKGILKMPGHGIGTLSILAGTEVDIPQVGFKDYLGLSDNIEIVPIRIAKSVVLLKSTAFVKALDYVVNELSKNENTRVHVITMSMGGVASRAWADLVNQAYEKGIFIVTAAGNNYRKLPTRTMIYPARFKRVVAACGVTSDYSPYHKSSDEDGLKIMEGNYGPSSLMDTAIAAFTPNVPWATYRFQDVVGIRGDGTSSATPQIAASAALYYVKYFDELEKLPEGWMKVEAIRNALFSSAKKQITGYDNDYRTFYGNGVLQAKKMLAVPVTVPPDSSKQERDTVSFPLFRLLLGIKGFDAEDSNVESMLETELMQLVLNNPALQKILDNEESSIEEMNNDTLKKFIDTVINDKDSSETLKEQLEDLKVKADLF